MKTVLKICKTIAKIYGGAVLVACFLSTWANATQYVHEHASYSLPECAAGFWKEQFLKFKMYISGKF